MILASGKSLGCDPLRGSALPIHCSNDPYQSTHPVNPSGRWTPILPGRSLKLRGRLQSPKRVGCIPTLGVVGGNRLSSGSGKQASVVHNRVVEVGSACEEEEGGGRLVGQRRLMGMRVEGAC